MTAAPVPERIWKAAPPAIAFAAVLALMSVECARGLDHALRLEEVRILEKGAYLADTGPPMNTDPSAPHEFRNLRLLSITDTVIGRPGLTFGIRYTAVGQPKGARAELTVVFHFPKGGMHESGTGRTRYRSVSTVQAEIGAVTFSGYRFDNDWEIVPGTWSVEVQYEGRAMAEQRFCVVNWKDVEARVPGSTACLSKGVPEDRLRR